MKLEAGNRRLDVGGRVGLILLLATAMGCGAKTGLSRERVESDLVDAGPACDAPCPSSTFCEPSCLVEGECVPLAPPSCDDGDRCTEDSCDLALDGCVNVVRLDDEDGDGAMVPLECGGTDCDDTDAEIHPGARERCNGVDDDCDELIDEGAELVPLGEEIPVAASEETDDAASLVWSGEAYVLGFWDYRGGDADVFLQRLDSTGAPLGEEVQVTTSAGDGYGPDLVWTGTELGVTWNDRRDGNFEVYFARFDGELRRLTGDIRITDDPGWSVYPEIVWSGREYLVVWQDDRSGEFEVFAQRIGPEGPTGANDRLSRPGDGLEAESPAVAFDGDSYHVAWIEGGLDRFELRVERLSQLLERQGFRVLSDRTEGTAGAHTIVAGGSVVAVGWEQERRGGWETMIALLSYEGELIATPVAMDPIHETAREVSLLWENSGVLAVWSGYDPPGFDLFYSVLAPDGTVALPPRELVRSRGDAVGTVLALGPGEVGVAWSDTRSGTYDVYFTRLLCAGL